MKLSPALTEGTRPSEPTRAAAPSEMMSPYRLGATRTWKSSGFRKSL